jgi:hypothetical protein
VGRVSTYGDGGMLDACGVSEGRTVGMQGVGGGGRGVESGRQTKGGGGRGGDGGDVGVGGDGRLEGMLGALTHSTLSCLGACTQGGLVILTLTEIKKKS